MCIMRKVELRVSEEEKYQVIKKLVDSNGNKKPAAIKLDFSIRTINRLIIPLFRGKKMLTLTISRDLDSM